jgi:hypothetical protein
MSWNELVEPKTQQLLAESKFELSSENFPVLFTYQLIKLGFGGFANNTCAFG